MDAVLLLLLFYLQSEIPADILVALPRLAARLLVHVQSPTQVVKAGANSLQRLVLVAHFFSLCEQDAADERRS